MVEISFTISHTVVKDYCLVNNHEIVMIWVDLNLIWRILKFGTNVLSQIQSPQFPVIPQFDNDRLQLNLYNR